MAADPMTERVLDRQPPWIFLTDINIYSQRPDQICASSNRSSTPPPRPAISIMCATAYCASTMRDSVPLPADYTSMKLESTKSTSRTRPLADDFVDECSGQSPNARACERKERERLNL